MEQHENLRMAQWWLKQLRNGTIAYMDAIQKIRKYLKDGNLTLADINSSEDELEACRVYGCKLLALHWLQTLRDGTIMFKTNVLSLENTLDEGGLRPEDIGTTEREIASFLCVDDETFKKRLRRPIRFVYSQSTTENPR